VSAGGYRENRHSLLPIDTNSNLPKDIDIIDSISYNTNKSTIEEIVMGTVAANDLKTKGVKAIEDALLTQPEASVSVRGQIKYVVMSQDHYHYLRECELEAALAESRADMASDRFVKETVAQHLKRLKQLNKASKRPGS